MSILPSSSRWPLYLAVAGLVIVITSVWYTNRLATQLAEIERSYVELYGEAMERVANIENFAEQKGDDVSTEQAIIDRMKTVPRILVDEQTGSIVDALGFGDSNTDMDYLEPILEGWIEIFW